MCASYLSHKEHTDRITQWEVVSVHFVSITHTRTIMLTVIKRLARVLWHLMKKESSTLQTEIMIHKKGLHLHFVQMHFFPYNNNSSFYLCSNICNYVPTVMYCRHRNSGSLCWEPRADECLPFKAWNRSEYSPSCFAHCQNFFSFS